MLPRPGDSPRARMVNLPARALRGLREGSRRFRATPPFVLENRELPGRLTGIADHQDMFDARDVERITAEWAACIAD